MKHKMFFLLIIIFCLLTACDGYKQVERVMPDAVHVDIYIPVDISLQEETILQIKVTQGTEGVEDAQEVEFEIWQHAEREEGVWVTGIHQGAGMYQNTHTFANDGIYFIQAHVKARGLQVMPMKQLIIGDVSKEELKQLENRGSQSEQGSHGHH